LIVTFYSRLSLNIDVAIPVFYVLVERLRGLAGRLVTVPEERAAPPTSPPSVNGDGAVARSPIPAAGFDGRPRMK
jgi:hypothetical protein